MSEQHTPAGWHRVPDGRLRYWDGSGWTENYAPELQQQVPYQPPRKGGALKWVLLAVGLVMVLAVGSCVAFIAAVGNEQSKVFESVSSALGTNAPSADSADEGATTSDGSGDQDNPVEVKEGQAFDIRGFAYAEGWKVNSVGGFGTQIDGLKVTNGRGEKDSALIEVKLWQGSEVLANISCTSEPIFAGTTVTLSCISGDPMPKSYDRITINDMF